MIIKIDGAKRLAIADDRVRQERDRLLAETDWAVVPDRNPSQDLLDYRQALRDIPQQDGFPDSVIWPTPPE